MRGGAIGLTEETEKDCYQVVAMTPQQLLFVCPIQQYPVKCLDNDNKQSYYYIVGSLFRSNLYLANMLLHTVPVMIFLQIPLSYFLES